MEEELITERLNSGSSDIVTVRGKKGFFDFDAPAETEGTPYPRHKFVTMDGDVYYLQLEKSMEGGRWEEAPHAEASRGKERAKTNL